MNLEMLICKLGPRLAKTIETAVNELLKAIIR